MNTVEYLDALQSKLQVDSDYAVSKALGISRQTMSRYRQGKNFFDDEISRKVASILGMHPGIVLLDMYAERTRDAETKSLWQEISAGFWSVLPLANGRRRSRRLT